MRARDVIGRKIVAVRQDRIHDEVRGFYWGVIGFTLDNGTELVLNACESENNPYVEVIAYKPQRRLAKGDE